MDEIEKKVKKKLEREQGRGRYAKQEAKNDKQNKFFVDLSKEEEILDAVLVILGVANNRTLGKEITFKDLAVYAVPKLSPKDIEKIQEHTLTDMERVQKLLEEYNQKNSSSINMGEFLVKRMNILKEGKDGK